MDKKTELVTFAQFAEKCERFEDMANAMNKLTRLDDKQELGNEERNLLSVAYKNVVGARRSAWRMIKAIETKEEKEENIALAKEFRVKIEAELDKICGEVLEILDEYLIPQAGNADSKVFYLKMKGDYFRYKAEYTEDDAKKKACDDAESSYQEAYELASKEMDTTHPNRLGLALNFSVFHYEIQNCPDKACHLAKKAFDDAIADLDKVDQSTYKDSTLIMQLLRDNLTLWTTDAQQDNQTED